MFFIKKILKLFDFDIDITITTGDFRGFVPYFKTGGHYNYMIHFEWLLFIIVFTYFGIEKNDIGDDL